MSRIFDILSEELPWYINVPLIAILLIASFVVLIYVIKPHTKNFIYKLYAYINDMSVMVDSKNYNPKTLKQINKKMRAALYCCDDMLGGEMYELENIVASLTKASNILRAMIIAKIPVESYGEYFPRVLEQLVHSKELLASFYMEDSTEELKQMSINPKKNIQNARHYLDDLK